MGGGVNLWISSPERWDGGEVWGVGCGVGVSVDFPPPESYQVKTLVAFILPE